MVKLRDAGYCNLKLLLICSVVYGHWIEPWIWSEPVLREQYRLIYLVHMPLFAFLSGLFLTGKKSCVRTFGRSLGLYLLCQTLAVLLGSGEVKWHTPFWHLWYLLSLAFWTGLAWLWFRFGRGRGAGVILTLALAVGCFAGDVPWLGRLMSGSRTVVFFPYFWLGVITKPDISREKLRLPGLLGLIPAVMAALWLRENTGVTFLYHAAPFGRMAAGAAARLACYVAGFGLGLLLLAWIPGKRFPFTRAGADTMAVFLVHGPVVAALRVRELPVWGYLPASMGLVWVIYQIFRWYGGLYGIVPEERRRIRWRRLEKHTKNTENRSTVSSCL